MARFLGLFGSKNGNGKSDEAFYLDNDQSKTLGDIDYMRTSRQIKRTYAKYKSVDQGGMKVIRQVSATSDFLGDDLKAKSAEPTFTPSETSFNNSTSSSNGSSGRVDSGMDMFRKMAKEVKKPR